MSEAPAFSTGSACGRPAFVAVGSNVDGAERIMEEALVAFEAAGLRVAAVARPVLSPFEDEDGQVVEGEAPVLDTVVECRSDASPRDLLARLQAIERQAGRDRTTPRVRTLDLDLLDAGAAIDDADLVLPHPRFARRAFVLGPWEEIAPLHVVTGSDASVLLHATALRQARPEAFGRLAPRAHPPFPDLEGAEVAVLEDERTLAAWRSAQGDAVVGVVPTMGALHVGHETLLRRARAECDAVLATLFVNPLQFAPGEDLARYPRTFDEDLALLRRAGVSAVYAPAAADLYPDGFATTLDPTGPALGLEGERRPGHFRGVATVVYKLWRRTRPHRAYFGRKDAQQLAVLSRMVEDLELEGDVVPCPTVREMDGLALSSRNRYLAPAERRRALGLSRALETMVRAAATGTRAADSLIDAGRDVLREADLDVDYLEVVDADSMVRCDPMVPDRPVLAVAAVRVGRTRLLDNRWLVTPSGVARA